MNIVAILEKRYSTKSFDPSYELTTAQVLMLEDALRLSPSSINVQPWYFIIATSAAGKARMAKGAEGFFEFNKPKILQASAVVLFASRVDITHRYLRHVLDVEERDGRFLKPEFKEQAYTGMRAFADIHQYDLIDSPHWVDKQLYLNAGNFLLSCACMGLDAVPMEGVEQGVLDAEFGLRKNGFRAVLLIALGRHARDDFNASLPKSRLPKEEIIEHC